LAAACRKVSLHATVAWRKRNLFGSGIQENFGRRKELAIAGIRRTQCAQLVLRKGRSHKGTSVEEGRRKNQIKNKFARGTQKGITKENKRLNTPKCKSGIRDRGIKRQHLRLRGKAGITEPRTRWQKRLKSKRTTSEFDRYALGVEFIKQTNETSNWLGRLRIWTLWRGRPPPKRKKKLRT
jgi:hypothetical protein